MNIVLVKIDNKKYFVVDKDTGEILANNCGFGYSSKRSAYEAFAKHRTKKEVVHKINPNVIKDWCKRNVGVIRTFNYCKKFDEYNEEQEEMLFQIIFREFKIDESYLDFSIRDLLKFLKKVRK